MLLRRLLRRTVVPASLPICARVIRKGRTIHLRWKLLLIASFVAAVIGAGGGFGLAYALLRFRHPYPTALTTLIVGEFLPVLMSVIASIFVYRHTARKPRPTKRGRAR